MRKQTAIRSWKLASGRHLIQDTEGKLFQCSPEDFEAEYEKVADKLRADGPGYVHPCAHTIEVTS